jgi:carbon-monoxide dehydrogenase medium subunit
MATVGGNLFTPPPGGDVATALLALDATVEAAGPGGSREIPMTAFFTGFLTNALAPDELVTAVRVPVSSDAWAFLKFGRRAANTPAVVTVAIRAPGSRMGSSPTPASPLGRPARIRCA